MPSRYDVDLTVWLSPNGPGTEMRAEVTVPDETPNELAVLMGLRAALTQAEETRAAWHEDTGSPALAHRWASFTSLELDALYAGLEAADRDGSIDHDGKALLAEIDDEYRRRFPERQGHSSPT
jgi:hypothetical protein